MDDKHKPLYWAMYFTALVGMERHPGKWKDGQKPLSIQQLANLADAMLQEHDDRWEK